ncbi:MAG: adenine deaminase [Cyclobacteriaceae bacterium]|nr:adenine deaminase [Cyclobacteriaceae bacterium]
MPSNAFRISGHLVDIPGRRTFPAEVHIDNGRIRQVLPTASAESQFILPGFIDAHVHVESSMLVPSEFARLAVVHGTVATVSDPHEIANVLGIPGVEFMINNGKMVPFKCYFGAPSCVPATSFETAGAVLDPESVDTLLSRPDIRYLAEMMNWPGVIHGDPMVMKKIDSARRHGKPVDGHAPGLTNEQAAAYIKAGISTDHECVSYEEARHKLKHGMKVIIREGSAARNFDALIGLLPEFENDVMFCSDDKHPDSLEDGHINKLVSRAVARGIDLFSILRAACLNPIDHYQLDVGRLREGDPADFIVVKDLRHFDVKETYVAGQRVAADGTTLIDRVKIDTPNKFHAEPLHPEQLQIKASGKKMRLIEAVDGQLITHERIATPKIDQGNAVSDPSRDVLKLVVVNRYKKSPPAIAFISGFGMKRGAIASSVAHDSHNIIAVGVDDESIARAINAIVDKKGGIAAVHGEQLDILPLPVAGIMSDKDGYEVSQHYKALDRMAKDLGSTLGAPFMTLSFMALLVIPSLKLSDKGLFDGHAFGFTPLFFD